MVTEIDFVDGNLIVTRVYDAPIEDVFDAWVETSKIKRWWGCAECTDVECEIEPKVGGKYNHHMTLETQQGTHQEPGFATLVKFDPPNRLAYTSNDPSDPMVIDVTFTAVEGGTQVRLVHSNIPDVKVDGDIDLRDIIRAGWSAAFGKLGGVLEEETAH